MIDKTIVVNEKEIFDLIVEQVRFKQINYLKPSFHFFLREIGKEEINLIIAAHFMKLINKLI